MNRITAITIGIVAACIFTIMASVNLDSQGVYYDELHQAPAAFSYLGKHPTMFTKSFGGIPLLNLSYSGAIKSNLYGLYLRYVSPHFTVTSWRMIGITFVAIGLLAFYLIAGTEIPLTAAIVFGALFLSDVSILLMTRHDWGPNALSMCLRLVFLAMWIRLALDDSEAGFKHFIAGAVVGLAIFEKLSAVVLLGPFLLLLLSAGKRNWRSWTLGALGLVAGSLPLLAVNAGTYWGHGRLISLTELSGGRALSQASNLLKRLSRYLELGQGSDVQSFILDKDPNPVWTHAEMILLPAALLTISIARYRLRSGSQLMLLANRMVGAYVTVYALLLLLPRETKFYHLLLGSPFQYAALALATPVFVQYVWQRSGKAAVCGVVFLAAGGALLANRLPNVTAVEASLASGTSSPQFDPALTRLAELAATHAQSAAFIAADWGTGAQVYCMGDGQDDLIYEPFLDSDPGSMTREITVTTKKDALYVLVTGIAPKFAESSRAILHVLMNSPAWQEVPIEKEFSNLNSIQIRKFARRTPQDPSVRIRNRRRSSPCPAGTRR